ncbi:MAG: thiamine-phosphate kinase [Gammaproteobacteria bacterium]|nr:thiamine-phosphate kinase [Gammaproteobacteria bacterium]
MPESSSDPSNGAGPDSNKGEFQLIHDYFQQQPLHRSDVLLGIGDDGAIVSLAKEKQLVLVMDTMISGVHFPDSTSAYDLGWKSLAVNLSDLAAMGAEPAWLTLALTLPHSDEQWVQKFSHGLFELASRYDVQLIGGDTTRGPLTVTVQAHGFVEQGQALLRNGAKAGDLIYVSGYPGEAALGLELIQSNNRQHPSFELLSRRLNRPIPRIELGLSLSGIATSCIDISDGLLADLHHILDDSGAGANIWVDQLPVSPAYQAVANTESFYLPLLSGGDDYELLFTIPANKQDEIAQIEADISLTCIGEITPGKGIQCLDPSGKKIEVARLGYDHFLEA